MQTYDHKRIEPKWQRIWEERELFVASVDPQRPKYYILDMFPYPSGAGLHVGHVTGYTATDILARYKRAKGFNVLHPMGWDSFGLPAEQYAIRTGTHPAITTEANIATYRRQLKSLGFSYDWSREVATSDPKYYKWTQWIFTKLYERGLAYEAEVEVNFCPTLGTVLANEEVEDGKSKEGGFPVEKRPLRQWILRITAYAERLIEGLSLVDWPDSLKRLQINWIGKSEGAWISFKVGAEDLSVFTTRPETLFGVTFLAIAPEHPLAKQLVIESQKGAVEQFEEALSRMDSIERGDITREKNGVWTGSFAIHPITGKKIPIWITDYVLMGYGTGAVMGVPAHDERDSLFAKKYQLDVLTVIEEGKMVCSDFINHLSPEDGKSKILDWIEDRGIGKRGVTYKLRDWLFSRQRYWGEPFPILHFPDGTKRALAVDELPLTPPDLSDFKPLGTGESPLAKVKSWVDVDDPKTGKSAKRETNTMPQWAGSCWYYLRFCDPHNDVEAWDLQKESYWMPVDLYVGGVEHAVLHLLYARFWHKVLYDIGLVSTDEPFFSLRNQGLVTARSYQLPSGLYIAPEEVEEKEGLYTQRGSGIALRSQVEKMSKSKLNGVTPDEVIEEFGADTLRLYEMFMGPFNQEKLWNLEAVSGCYRFLTRVYALATSEKVSDDSSSEGMKLAHRLVDGVEKDIESFGFNTAIAKMMEFVNHFSPLSTYPKEALRMVARTLHPFAPHIAEEIWEILGGVKSLTEVPFPTVDPQFLIDTETLYIVQVNGKIRGKFSLPKEMQKEVAIEFVKRQEEVEKHLQGSLLKVVFVPGKLINFVMDL